MSENRQKYTFREIKGRDIFKLARFFKKVDMSEIMSFLKESGNLSVFLGQGGGSGEDYLSNLGTVLFKIINIIIDNLDKLESEIFELLSDFSDLEIKEIEELRLEEFENMISDFFTMPQIMDFSRRMLQRLGLQTTAPQTEE